MQSRKSLAKDGDIKNNDDETLLIINKSKHPKKGEYKEQNGRTHIQKKKKSTKKGEPQKEHQVLEPLLVTRNISNKEGGRLLERTPSIEGPSSTARTHLKTKSAYACCNATIKMCTKLIEESFQCPLLPMPCWHIDEEICSPYGVNIQKLLQGETCPLGTNCDKDHPLPKLQLSLQTHEEKQPMKPNQTQMGLTMTMFANVQTPLIDNTMSSQRYEDRRAKSEGTWVYFWET